MCLKSPLSNNVIPHIGFPSLLYLLAFYPLPQEHMFHCELILCNEFLYFDFTHFEFIGLELTGFVFTVSEFTVLPLLNLF